VDSYHVYRYGSNTANQPGDPGPRLVAIVTAESAHQAMRRASRRATVYNNQYLDARLSEEVCAEESDLDARVGGVDHLEGESANG
jgi:hypothetical protein